jgi:hypothetical protein
MVIAALSGGDGPDDQPDDQKYRSDVHLDLRSIVRIKSDGKASQLPVFTLARISAEAYPWAAISSPVRANSMSFPEVWKLAGHGSPWQLPDVWKLPVIR